MANISSKMNITEDTLSQISRELLGEDVSFTFTKLLIGDGKYPLKDDSTPVLDHVFEFPLEEISRTGNNILLTATIDENVYLTISELALYCTYADGSTHIFSKIEGLSVKKSANLSYNLIIHVRLDINVVNTVAFPEIVLAEVDYPKLSEFKTVRDVYTYVTENLERMVKTNALGIGEYYNLLSFDKDEIVFLPSRPVTLSEDIHGVMTERKPVGVGYDRAQVYYRFQDKIEDWENQFFATYRYGLLQNKFTSTPKVTRTFNPDKVEAHGRAYISELGEGEVRDASTIYVNEDEESLVGESETFWVDVPEETFVAPHEDFFVDSYSETMFNSASSYISANATIFPNYNRWNTSVTFKTDNDVDKAQTVLCFAGYCNYQPLILSIGNRACTLSLGQKETMEVRVNETSEVCEREVDKRKVNDIDYYSWVLQEGKILNPHVNVVGNLNETDGVLSSFSSSNYASPLKEFVPGNNKWEIKVKFTTGSTPAGTVIAFGTPSESGVKGIVCSLDPKFKAAVSFDDEETGLTLESTFNLESNTTYTASIRFDGTGYYLYINNILEDVQSSDAVIHLTNESVFLIGVDKTSSSVLANFTGSIDLKDTSFSFSEVNWTGALTSTVILAGELNPTPSTGFLDAEGYPLTNVLFKALYTHSIVVNEPLFSIEPLTTYTVSIKFNGKVYEAFVTKNGVTDQVLYHVSTEKINPIKSIIFGAQFSGFGGYGYPFYGVLYLADFQAVFEDRNNAGALVSSQIVNFNTEEIQESVVLKDFFYIPEYKYSYFTVNNLGRINSIADLTVYEGDLSGNEDTIDLSNPKGASLCVKANLYDTTDKVILAKGNTETEMFSFILKEENKELLFTYFLEDTSETLTVNLNDKITYITNPINIVVTVSPEASPTLKLYINNSLESSIQLGNRPNIDTTTYYLTNKLSESSEPYDKRVVQDILSFEGELSPKEIYYINNVLDTNF